MLPSPIILDPDTLPVAGRHWDWTIGGLLGALLLFMPAAFGAVEAWSELVVVLGAAALSLCLAARIAFDREFNITRTWLYLPLLLFVALVALQLLHLPTDFVRELAPSNVATKEEMLGQAFEPNRLSEISFYPHATAEHLRLLLIGSTIFVTVASVLRRGQQIKVLLSAVFVIGCAEAILSLAQIATGSGSIYWYIPIKQSLNTAGTFVNYSNFAQFMNLSLGAGLALLLVRIEEQRRNEIHGGGWGLAARGYWEKNAWLCAGIVVCALSVFASMSRNGAISMLVAAAITGAALFQRGSFSWRGWLVAALPAAVLIVLLIFGFDIVYSRLSSLHDSEAYGVRWEMTAAAFRAWQQYPVWGTGLGTHEVVAPLFEAIATPVVAGHADNDYAQLLEETGLAGGIIVGTFIIGIAALLAQLAFRGRKSASMSVYGLMFGLVAVAIHSATDFGQRLPANFALSATLCGVAVAISRAEPRQEKKRHYADNSGRLISPRLRIAVASAVLVVLVGIWGWAARDAYAAHLGERWWAAAVTIENRNQKNPEAVTDDDYVNLIAAAEGAFQSEPNNVNYGYWLNYYRWESLSRATGPDTGQVVIHPDTIPFVKRIADELTAVRQICPTFGPPYALEGQLRLFVLKEPDGAELIRKGARLASYDPPTCLVAGELAAREGRLDEAEPLLARAVELHPGYYREVLELYLSEVKRPDLARALAGRDYNRLNELATAFEAVPAYREEGRDVRIAAEAALRRHVSDGQARPSDVAALARIDRDQGDVASAIDLYRRALSQDYQQIEWRLNLAHALADSNQLEAAIHEVKIVLRLRPRNVGATKLLEELVARSENARARSRSQ